MRSLIERMANLGECGEWWRKNQRNLARQLKGIVKDVWDDGPTGQALSDFYMKWNKSFSRKGLHRSEQSGDPGDGSLSGIKVSIDPEDITAVGNIDANIPSMGWAEWDRAYVKWRSANATVTVHITLRNPRHPERAFLISVDIEGENDGSGDKVISFDQMRQGAEEVMSDAFYDLLESIGRVKVGGY